MPPVTPRPNNVNFTINSGGGGGGPPDGGQGAIQANNGPGTFYGDNTNAYWDIPNNLFGFGMGASPSLISRGTFKAPQSTLTAPSNVVITPHLEILADNPLLSVTAVSGPDDSSIAAITATQNDGSGSYFADNTVNITYTIWAVVTINGTDYFTGTASVTGFTDNGDNSNFSVGLNWILVSGATSYIIYATGTASSGNPNWIQNVGNVTSFSDDGNQTSNTGFPSSFSSLNPFVNGTAPTAFNSLSAGEVNIGSGHYTENGSTYFIEVDSVTYINTVAYVSGSPTTTSFADGNSGQTFDIGATWTDPGGSETDGIYRVSTDNVNWTYHFTGSTTAYTDVNNPNDPVAQAAWGRTYSFGIVRTAHAYGEETNLGPVHYSPNFSAGSYTDTNSVNGWVFVHNLTYGVTNEAKVLGSNDGYSLSNSYTTTGTTLIEGQSGLWTGDNVVTPVHYGLLANGSNLNIVFHFYAYDNSIYSSSFATGTSTDPNDGLYYWLGITFTAGGGSSTKILRNINGAGFNSGYLLPTSSSFNYFDGSPSFTDGTTVTPNTREGSALRAINNAPTASDEPQFIIQNGGATAAMKMEFRDSSNNALASYGFAGVTTYLDNKDSSGLLYLKNNGTIFSLFDKFHTYFNETFSNSHIFRVESDNAGQPLIYAATSDRSVGINGNGSTPNNAKLYVYARNNSDINLDLQTLGGTQTKSLWISGSGVSSFFSGDGRLTVNSGTDNGTVLNVQGQGSNIAAFTLGHGSFKSSPVIDAIENNGSHIRVTDSASNPYFLTRTQANALLTANALPVTNSNGNLVDSGFTDNLSTLATCARQFEAKGGISIDSSQNLTIGNNSTVIMGSASNFTFNTTTGTKFGTATNQKLAFYGSTAIVQPSGDALTALSNLGLVATPTLSAGDITSGILPIANGGTGNSSFTTNSIPYFDGTKFAEDNANLAWVESTKILNLGAGISIPANAFTVTQANNSNGSGFNYTQTGSNGSAVTSGTGNPGGTIGFTTGAGGNNSTGGTGNPAGSGGPLNFNTGNGGNYTGTGSFFANAGQGGNINFTTGMGGTNTRSAVGAFSGSGGNINFTTAVGTASTVALQSGGAGGSVSFTVGSGGSSLNKGGGGGGVTYFTGNGGFATGTTATANVAGTGGSFQYSSGAGGNASGSTTSNTAGAGGDITFGAGTGGNATGTNPIGARGGNVLFTAGAATSSTGTSANGGIIYFIPGANGPSGGQVGYVALNANTGTTRGGTIIGANTAPNAQLDIRPITASTVGHIVQGFTSQSADLTQWRNSSSAILSKIDASGILTLGLSGTQTGTINFNGTTSGTVTVNPAAAAGTWTMTLPTSSGSVGQSLITDGTGVTSWSSILPTVATVSLTGQTSDIGSTNFTGANVAGLYRVSYSLEDTAADITAGAVTLNIAYTADAGAISIASAAQVLTGTGLTQGTIFVQLASGSISYSTSHTGLFGSAQYALYMTVERLK